MFKNRTFDRLHPFILLIAFSLAAFQQPTHAAETESSWPSISRTQRPWAYWWWMGSAVDTNNITKELSRYHTAGMGGVHIVPIYGAKGWETNFISYLSPRWLEMLRYTVIEANRLDLGVDMTTGSGWCFGGPKVTDDEANASVVANQIQVAAGEKLPGTFNPRSTQALMAFGPDGWKEDLLPQLKPDGSVNWTAQGGPWRIFAISQTLSGQKVKRSGPGGEGWMLNLFYPKAMTNYLRTFDAAFANYSGPKPRAQYHDSYEYQSNWSPDFFAQFEKRRGYRLQEELPALFGKQADDRAGRVKSDYRETISELMSEVTLPLWASWSHKQGFITRDQAHGSPGNLLDLYAAADVPETEMFHTDRNKLISKFASSAAHTTGKPLVSSETGTWLEEHFTEKLADMKFLLDDLFLSGVNHVFYHGTCYSPDEAAWPGWLFYASYEMNPRNSVWRDVPALNAYAARCQSVLQSGQPDNDVLVYWPIFDRWNSPNGLVQPFTVHAREWFEGQSIGKAAEWLWSRGYQFDYVSDRQLAKAKVSKGRVSLPGGEYQVIVVPKCELMPLETLSNLVALAKTGATVLFEDQLPKDVPGWGHLDQRRSDYKKLIASAESLQSRSGKILSGSLARMLNSTRTPRETLFDQPGLMCIRRAVKDGRFYFIANRGDSRFEGWLPIASEARSVTIMDPLTGRTGIGRSRATSAASAEVYVQLAPGESVILKVSPSRKASGRDWNYLVPSAGPIALQGTWQVKFLQGGPELPAPFETAQLQSWTELGDTNAQRFAGTALYSLRFDAPVPSWNAVRLDLGKVCQSARVRLNGRDLGTLITPPFRVAVEKLQLKDNLLEVEVTNVSANRIRDLDRRGVNWKNFYDINFVNLDYKPFDASNWPLTDSGLLGPVTLTAVAAESIH